MNTKNRGPLQRQLFGYCNRIKNEDEKTPIDVTNVAQKLILFDTYTLISIRLSEIPQLMRMFGYNGLLSLLKSGALRISCHSITIGERGNARPKTVSGKRGQPLPLGVFDLATIRPADHQVHIDRCFSEIQADTGLSDKKFGKLRRMIEDHLIELPETAGDQSIVKVTREVDANSPMIKILVARSLREKTSIMASPQDFHLDMRLGTGTYESETNLGRIFDLSEETVDSIVSQGLLGLGALNWRIEQMELFHALTEFSEEEIPFLTQKLDFLVRDVLPGKIESQFQRVCTIRGMPTIGLDENGKINAHKLLEIRQTRACEEFRQWLQQAEDLSDIEIEDRLNSFRSHIGNFLTSNPIKISRFVLLTIFGLFSFINPAASITASAIDAFILEKLFPYDGPASFANHLYPSIFKQQ